MDIFATITAAGVPVNGLVDMPEIQITDDTGAIVQAFVAMTDLGQDGKHLFAYTIPAVARSYTFLVDADPLVTGQVTTSDRFYFGSFSGEADIIAVSTDLANLDVAVSTRATPADIAASEATILAAIGALNNISIADVQTAMTAQGYTSARAVFLDFLDVAVSSRNAVTPMTAGLSQTEHDATQAAIAALVVPMDVVTSQAEHDATQALVTAVGALVTGLNDISVSDILTAVLGSGNTVDAELSAILALRDLIEGGRDIDFVGNDVLGWQRIERTVAGVLIRRYNLLDETGSRINETVASFIGRSGMISAEVAI